MKLKGRTKRQLMKVTALVMFAAIIITNTAPLYAEEEGNNSPAAETAMEMQGEGTEDNGGASADATPVPETPTEEPAAPEKSADGTQEPAQEENVPEVVEPTEEPGSSPEVTEEPQKTPEATTDPTENPAVEPTAEATEEPGATTVPEGSASPEKTAEVTPSMEPSVSPSAEPAVTPVTSPSVSPTPSISPSISPSPSVSPSISPSPSVSPSVSPSPSATPTASPEKTEAKIDCDGYSISGSGLKELTVSFDTADLNSEDSFNLVLSTDADSVSIIGNAFSAKEDGRYEVDGVGKDALNITFGKLNEEEFTLTAEGTDVTFIYNASNEPEETDEGFIGNASIKAVSEKEAEPEIKLVEKSIMTKTSDGAWVTVAGLLPEGVTVTAVPVNVEIEGKEILAAYDITIWDVDGKEYKITEAVTVSISAPVLKETEAEEVSVYHMENENAEAEKVADVGIDYNKVSFDAEGFSIYIVVKDAEGNEVGKTYNLSDTFDLTSFAKIETTVSVNGSEISSEEEYASNTIFKLALKYELINTLINLLKTEIGEDTEGTIDFSYTMPAEIKGVAQAEKGNIIDSSTNGVCGTYEIGADGVVHFYFNKSFIKENSSISGTFNYYFSLTDVTTITENKIEFQFPGTADTIVISVKEAEITGWKDVSNSGEEITFSIHLNNGDKKCTNVIVTDTPGSNLAIDMKSIKVIKNGSEIQDGFEIGTPDSNGVFTITFTELDVNDQIEITYPAKIKNNALDENHDGLVDDLGNKASWSVDGQGKGEDDATPWISTAKNGSKSGRVEGQSIKWTVNLNDGTVKNDVSGKEYTDVLTSDNQKYDKESIRIYANGSDVTDSLKNSIEWTDKSFTLKLPDDAGKSAYKITYTTVPSTPLGIGNSVTVKNEGTFGGSSIGGDTETITRTEQVGLTKKHDDTHKTASDGIVIWTSVITPDAGTDGLVDPVFRDFLGWTDWSNYFTWCGSVFDENSLNISYDGAVLAEENYTVEYSKSSNDASANDTMTIRFNGTYNGPITITYQSQDNMEGAASGKTINNVCQVGNTSASDYVWYKKEEGSVGSGIFKNGNNVWFDDDNTCYAEWIIYANAEHATGGIPVTDFEGKTIYIVDTLPDGMEYVDGSWSYVGSYGYNNGNWPAAEFTGNAPNVSEDGKTLTFKVDNVHNEVIKITFKTKITKFDEELTNHVSYNDGSDELGTATGKVTAKSDLLQKSGTVIGDAKTNIQYTIVVNEKEMDYLADSDYLILEDTIPENVELVNGSIQFDVNEGTSYLYDSKTRVLKIQVPDGKKVTVTYEVTPDLEGITPSGADYTVNVSNTVVLSGSANVKSENKSSYVVHESSASAGGDKDKLTLQKIDAQNTGTTLTGATYELYSVNVGTKEITLIKSKTTGNNGIITFENLSYDQVYYYVETAAPDGYILDNTKYYFIYKSQTEAYNEAVEKFNTNFSGETLRTSDGGDFISCTNVKKSTAGIVATKILEGANVADYSFNFKLTSVDSSGNELNGGAAYSETVTASKTGEIKFSEITYESEGRYYYKIEEVKGSETQITYDDNSYIVIVDVKLNNLLGSLTSTVIYPENQPVVFTNTYVKTGNLTISKTLEGNDVEATKYFKFTITLDGSNINGTYSEVEFVNGSATITLKGGESKTIEGLPDGVGYTVTEDSSDGYVTTVSGVTGTSRTATGTISESVPAVAAFTNTRNTYGNLTVSKTVAGNAADTNKEFNFKVTLKDKSISGTYGGMTFSNGIATFTLKHGESKTAENLPTGVEYTVEEEDYTAAGYYITEKTGETGTISDGCNLTATFKNTRNAEGSLTVSKTLAGNDTDSNKDFTFTIELNDSSINGTYSEVIFTNGKATIKLKGGESKTIEGLPNGVGYTVTETDYSSDGYVTTVSGTTGTSNVTSGTISEDTVAVAEFTNTRNTYGNLTVKKTVAGNAADTNKEFNFKVTLSDTSINGLYGGMTFSDGVATFVLKHGENKTAENLPTGVEYTVKEEDYTAAGYYITKQTGETGTISGGCNLTAAFENTRNAEGSLTVSKTLAGNDTDSNKDFTFTIELNDSSINGTYSEVIFTNGKATIKLKGGESKTIEGLPNGVGYTVTETDYSSDGYETTVSGVTGISRTATGIIKENVPAEAAFTNTRNTYGNLTVSKTVTGNAADTDKEFIFKVTLSDKSISGTYGGMTFSNGVATFALKDSGRITAEGLPTGVIYTVEEEKYAEEGYITTKNGAVGEIYENCDLTAAFTNTRNTKGSLTVSKTLAGNDTDSNKDFTFTIELNDSGINETYSEVEFINGSATITLKGGEVKVIEGLPNGVDYTVTETDYSSDGYVTTVSGTTGTSNVTSGTISEDTVAVAEFTNTRNTYGNLTVKKTVAGNAADKDKEFSFTVTLSDRLINKTYGDMSFTNGVATFTLKHGESKTAVNLPTGVSYTIEEEDYTVAGYTTEKTGETGTISDGCNLTATFKNTRNAEGSLTVSKTLAGNDTDSNKDFTFTIELNDSSINGTYSEVIFTNGKATIKLKGGESKTIEGLPNGVGYTVTETDYSSDGYVTTVSGTTGTSNVTSGTISEDTVAVAEFTNTRNTYGNLTVKKTVVGNAADTNKEFNFKVTLSDKSINGLYGDMTFSNGVATFKLKHDESWTANSLPTGVSYTVEEEDYTAAGYTTKKTGETGTITGGCNLTAAFENTRNAEGSLTISKTLAGNDTDKSKDFTFTIKLNDSGINGTYSGVVFTNGEANLILKGGENKVIEGLPNGVGYTITESDYSGDGYVTTVSGTTGTNREVSGVISEAESFVAAFTNTKDTYGKLTVSKTVAGNEADLEKEFSFTVTLDNSLINGLYGEMTFSDGVATFTLKHDESKTAENLPTGVSYTVTETDYTADGYVTTKSDDTGTITAGCDLTAAFTNTYVPAPISVSGKKTWDDNNNEYGERPEEITINLLADGEKIESKKVTEADNWSWSFTDLPKYSENGNEITYTISEEDIKHYTANVTGFDVTNKYTPEETEVKVTKVWEDNGDEDGIRPAKIMVQLYEDRLFDKKVGDPVELSVENGWTYVWTKLPRTKLFSNINYTVKELGAVDAEGKVIDIEGYTCTISEDTTNNIVITNSHEPTPKPTPTPTATATPSATSTSTPTVTPTATPSETPTATPSATPAETPSATPEVTPERTPDNTPEATPDSTPEATPETTPESTPVPSETPAATEAPTETPAPADEPETPDDGPERTPETRPENTPAPTPVRQVLGANRVRIRASEGAVLGARRGLDCAVLGKRRRPGTGDSASIIMWVLMMSAAVGGVLTSIIMLITGRKRKNS